MTVHKNGVRVKAAQFKDIAEKSHSKLPLISRKTYNEDTARLLETINMLTRDYNQHVGKRKDQK